MRPITSINGVTPAIEPVRGGYRITKSDLYSDASGRSAETGRMLSYLIRSGVTTIELEYHGTSAEIAGIEALFNAANVSVTYLDGTAYETRTFYPSDRQRDAEVLRDKGQVVLSFSLIEV